MSAVKEQEAESLNIKAEAGVDIGSISLKAMAEFPDLYEASILELQAGLERGDFTSVDLVNAYLARIEEVNKKGAALNAVTETNPNALHQARNMDKERKEGKTRGPLHGIPILLKDNIGTVYSEGMNTTAGSLALLGSVVQRDAHIAMKLRQAGAIFLGKASMSEWANYRGDIVSGFSGRARQITSPYFPNADPSGSSGGSGVGAALGLAAGTIGTETDGSIVSPSSRNNIVGIKPTVGLTSRAGVIPLAFSQDTIGPMCRTVEDAAIMLNAIAGPDPRDEITMSQPKPVPNYRDALKLDALKGARLGVPRLFQGTDTNIIAAFDEAFEVLKELGATIVDPAEFPNAVELKESTYERLVLSVEFKVAINKYLQGLVHVPTGVKSLADLIQFNIDHADEELTPPFYNSQSKFIQSEATTMDDAYRAALAADYELGRSGGIDATLRKFDLDALILPTDGFTSAPAAIAGYPLISVPLGFQPVERSADAPNPTIKNGPNVPFGISFMGTAYSEFKLIGYAYAYEQKTHNRLRKSAFPEAVPKTQLKDIVGKS